MTQKIAKLKKKNANHDHDKYLTKQDFNNLRPENFAARLKQASLASKSNIADFVKQANFDEKLKNLNKKFTLNKARHVEVKNKLYDLSKTLS